MQKCLLSSVKLVCVVSAVRSVAIVIHLLLHVTAWCSRQGIVFSFVSLFVCLPVGQQTFDAVHNILYAVHQSKPVLHKFELQ